MQCYLLSLYLTRHRLLTHSYIVSHSSCCLFKMCVISSEKCIIVLSLFVVGVHLLTAEIGMRWRARLYDTLYIAGSSSSQISVEKTTRRRQSQRSDAGDGREIAAVTMSSVSTWQQFTTSVQSAAYFCLVTCPTGMFITVFCCSVYRKYFCAAIKVILLIIII